MTTQSVLANQEELPSNDDISYELSEDLPDPKPVNIPEPTIEFISNPTVDSIPVPNTVPVSDSILSNSGTSSVPLISLVSAEAFMRSMQLSVSQFWLMNFSNLILLINRNLIPTSRMYLKYIMNLLMSFLGKKLTLFHLIGIVI
jgi:hypothetical protein